jgi:hypothetical protein
MAFSFRFGKGDSVVQQGFQESRRKLQKARVCSIQAAVSVEGLLVEGEQVAPEIRRWTSPARSRMRMLERRR